MSHFTYTILFATALSTAIALFDRKPWVERIYRGVYVFGGLLLAIFGIGWSMYLINP